MIVLLVIASIGILLYGYLLMDRLDRFMQRGGFAKEPEVFINKEILLYGEPEAIGMICRALDDASVTYDCTVQPEIKDGVIYRWIGAFSKDDEENLLFCLWAKKKNAGIRTMAKCNDPTYESVFRQTGIVVVFQKDVSISRILACLRG